MSLSAWKAKEVSTASLQQIAQIYVVMVCISKDQRLIGPALKCYMYFEFIMHAVVNST